MVITTSITATSASTLSAQSKLSAPERTHSITGTTPGQGNFPVHPKFLAPPMPWPAWRHMTDEELWAVAAYLKRGVKPVRNQVQDSDGPPDFWASEYAVPKIGTFPAAPFPAAAEGE